MASFTGESSLLDDCWKYGIITCNVLITSKLSVQKSRANRVMIIPVQLFNYQHIDLKRSGVCGTVQTSLASRQANNRMISNILAGRRGAREIAVVHCT
jgi:hypothetical protein